MPNHDEASCKDTSHHDDKGNHLPRPPYHPCIAWYCSGLQNAPSPIARYHLRPINASTAELAIGNLPVVHREFLATSRYLNTCASAFAPQASPVPGASRPCIFYIHPGGPWAGNRFCTIEQVLKWVVELDFICVSIEYRFSPENRFPTALEDCYHVLRRVMKYNCLFPDPATIKLDKRNVCVVSGMGGAAVAASLALRVRQAKEVEEVGIDWSLKGMFLYSPMLLCSSDTTSAAQFYKGDIWDTDQVQRMWSHYVKGELPVTTFECERHQHLQEWIKASPVMEDVLTDLPATYIDAGACETHRSEAVRRAEQMWCDGGDCELHIWSGACCNFTYWFPGLHVSKSAIDARRNWLERTLCGTP